MIVEYWSDFTCPFCYIAETRMKKALRELGLEKETKVVFKAFQLIPSAKKVPTRNMVESFSHHYRISMEDARARVQYINEMGRAEGLAFNYDTAGNSNTFDSLRLAKLAQTKGDAFADRFIERMYRAFFEENLILADHDVLRRICDEMGLPGSEVDEVLDGNAFADAVLDDQREAYSFGLSAVPFFAINRRYGIPGAIDTSEMKGILKRAFDEEEIESVKPGMVCGPDGCHPSDGSE